MAAVDWELRRNIRRNLFGCVAELADLAFQRATWLDPEMQNPHFGYVEFVECFYDAAAGSYDEANPASNNAPLKYWIEAQVLSQAEMDAIWPLHLALKAYRPKDQYAFEAILNDPAWQAVGVVAAKTRDNLIGMVERPEELADFENELPDAANKRWP